MLKRYEKALAGPGEGGLIRGLFVDESEEKVHLRDVDGSEAVQKWNCLSDQDLVE